MRALRLRIEIAATDERDLIREPIIVHRSAGSGETAPERFPFTRLTVEPSDFRCPHCDSIIYSRRHKLCGLCGRTLPEEYLFGPVETERLENILKTEQERHRRWMRRSRLEVLRV